MHKQFTAAALTAIALGGFFLSAFVIGTVYNALAKRQPWLERFMPTMAIIGILYVTAMTTASARCCSSRRCCTIQRAISLAAF